MRREVISHGQEKEVEGYAIIPWEVLWGILVFCIGIIESSARKVIPLFISLMQKTFYGSRTQLVKSPKILLSESLLSWRFFQNIIHHQIPSTSRLSTLEKRQTPGLQKILKSCSDRAISLSINSPMARIMCLEMCMSRLHCDPATHIITSRLGNTLDLDTKII